MSNSDKAAKGTAFDLDKLRHIAEKAKLKYRYEEKIEQLEDALTAEIRRRNQEKAQHDREIELITRVKESPLPSALPIIGKRIGRDALDAVIDTAIRHAVEPANYHSVFAEMGKLAAASNRPTPLLGPASRAGIPYQKANGEREIFTPRALKGRLQTRQKHRP